MTVVVYYVDVPVLFAAVVSDQEDAPEDLVVTWSSDVDGLLALDTSINEVGETIDTMLLSQGLHTISVQVTDGSGKTDTDEVSDCRWG